MTADSTVTVPLHRIADGAYEAVVTEQGAALRALRHAGRDLVFDRSAAVPFPRYAGALLAPWPNRIDGGRYSFAGDVHQLPVDEVDRGNALHGLVLWERWGVVDVGAAALTLAHTIWPRPGYPFTVGLEVRYELGSSGLTQALTATNLGSSPAPVGLGTHPYLCAGAGTLDEWRLELPCRDVLTVDDRLIPVALVRADAVGLDFRTPRPIGDAVIDHAYTGIRFDGDGRAAATMTDADGEGVRVGWDSRAEWLQVYTLQLPGGPDHRRALAIEPMTCAPDAFNGRVLTPLAPGERLTLVTTFEAVTG